MTELLVLSLGDASPAGLTAWRWGSSTRIAAHGGLEHEATTTAIRPSTSRFARRSLLTSDSLREAVC